jgi:hypothetical protein
MSALRFSSLIILFPILFAACGRSDLIRIRLLAPLSEAKKDHSILSNTNESSTPTYTNTSSGGSLYFLLKSIGLGYTTVTTKFEKTGSNPTATNLKETTTLKTNFADVAFGIGENYSFMWGAGILTGGERKTELDYGNNAPSELSNNYLGGHSLFFVLGHHGFGFETLLGYRMNFIKSEFDDSVTKIPNYMGKLPTEENVSYESSKIRLTTSQVQLGIGFTF